MESCSQLLDSIGKEGMTAEIQNALFKAWDVVHGFRGIDGVPFARYEKVLVSISGGADSDIMLDMIERVGHPLTEVKYVFFDTGVEYAATKRHLDFLETKYNIKIERLRAKLPVPAGVKKYGVPFLSKRVSDYIARLQKHDFTWEDAPFETLYANFPRCKVALRWWCNLWPEGSRANISQNKWLKEFLVANPPNFLISDKCCDGAKKRVGNIAERDFKPDVVARGMRRAEGGVRASAYSTCFDERKRGESALFLPIFWFSSADKRAYETRFGVSHSDCYSVYGLSRTGCAGCPFGRNFEQELQIAEIHEPQLYKAVSAIFEKSYWYTRKYRAFARAAGEGEP